jgi:hypothetical protein
MNSTFAEKLFFINSYAFNILHINCEVINTTIISCSVNVYWKIFLITVHLLILSFTYFSKTTYGLQICILWYYATTILHQQRERLWKFLHILFKVAFQANKAFTHQKAIYALYMQAHPTLWEHLPYHEDWQIWSRYIYVSMYIIIILCSRL